MKQEEHKQEQVCKAPGICFEEADQDVKFAENLNDRAQAAMSKKEVAIAKGLFESADRLLKKTAGKGRDLAQLRLGCNYSNFLIEAGQYKKAKKVAENALCLSKSSLDKYDNYIRLYNAVALCNKADACTRLNELAEAGQSYDESVVEISRIQELSFERDLDLCVAILNEAKVFHQKQGNAESADTLAQLTEKFKGYFVFYEFQKAGFRKELYDRCGGELH